jgi:hypothetical protein
LQHQAIFIRPRIPNFRTSRSTDNPPFDGLRPAATPQSREE